MSPHELVSGNRDSEYFYNPGDNTELDAKHGRAGIVQKDADGFRVLNTKEKESLYFAYEKCLTQDDNEALSANLHH